MISSSFISEFQRKAERSRQTGAALSLEHEQTVRIANIQSAAFVTNIVCPILHEAETRLAEASLPALATDRINQHTARCMLTVNLLGGGEPAVLAFEAWLGSAVPRLRWMGGGRVHTFTGFDRGGVEQIVNDFVDSTLQKAADAAKEPLTNSASATEVTGMGKSLCSRTAVRSLLIRRNQLHGAGLSAEDRRRMTV